MSNDQPPRPRHSRPDVQPPTPNIQSPAPNTQSPTPNTQSPTPITRHTLPPTRGELPQHGVEREPVPGLVLGYFAAALVWHLLATLGLVLIAPDLALGLSVLPATMGVVHALSLGVLGSAVFGAAHQFIPAVTGVPPRSLTMARTGFWLVQLGVVLLVAGFILWIPALQAAGWVFLLPGIVAASWNTLPARARAVRNHPIATAVLLGHGALGVALILGLVRIGDGLGWWHTSRDAVLLAHLHLGIAGFGTVTAIGVTGAMIPAFLESRIRGPFPAGISWGASFGLLLLTAGALTATPLLTRAGGAVLLGSVALFVVLLSRVFLSRTRPLTGGLGFVLAALVCLTLTLALGARLLFLPTREPALWIVYVLLGLAGWIALLVLGVMHHVGPRLLTLRRARRAATGVAVSRAAFTPHAGVAWLSLALSGPGVLVLALGVLRGEQDVARTGALLMAAGSAMVVFQTVLVLRRQEH